MVRTRAAGAGIAATTGKGAAISLVPTEQREIDLDGRRRRRRREEASVMPGTAGDVDSPPRRARDRRGSRRGEGRTSLIARRCDVTIGDFTATSRNDLRPLAQRDRWRSSPLFLRRRAILHRSSPSRTGLSPWRSVDEPISGTLPRAPLNKRADLTSLSTGRRSNELFQVVTRKSR